MSSLDEMTSWGGKSDGDGDSFFRDFASLTLYPTDSADVSSLHVAVMTGDGFVTFVFDITSPSSRKMPPCTSSVSWTSRTILSPPPSSTSSTSTSSLPSSWAVMHVGSPPSSPLSPAKTRPKVPPSNFTMQHVKTAQIGGRLQASGDVRIALPGLRPPVQASSLMMAGGGGRLVFDE
jgi:hypothetical protein